MRMCIVLKQNAQILIFNMFLKSETLHMTRDDQHSTSHNKIASLDPPPSQMSFGREEQCFARLSIVVYPTEPDWTALIIFCLLNFFVSYQYQDCFHKHWQAALQLRIIFPMTIRTTGNVCGLHLIDSRYQITVNYCALFSCYDRGGRNQMSFQPLTAPVENQGELWFVFDACNTW